MYDSYEQFVKIICMILYFNNSSRKQKLLERKLSTKLLINKYRKKKKELNNNIMRNQQESEIFLERMDKMTETLQEIQKNIREIKENQKMYKEGILTFPVILILNCLEGWYLYNLYYQSGKEIYDFIQNIDFFYNVRDFLCVVTLITVNMKLMKDLISKLVFKLNDFRLKKENKNNILENLQEDLDEDSNEHLSENSNEDLNENSRKDLNNEGKVEETKNRERFWKIYCKRHKKKEKINSININKQIIPSTQKLLLDTPTKEKCQGNLEKILKEKPAPGFKGCKRRKSIKIQKFGV